LKDIDNLLKFLLDTLEMVVYSNNKCISNIQACKILVYHVDDKKTSLKVKALDAA
jgi:Holliday junction resolvase RusA-like endonuclease